MLESGTRIEMTKGYKGVSGRIQEETDSSFPLYVVELDNGIHMVAGPTAFEVVDQSSV